MADALLNDLRALVIFLPKSANTIFAKFVVFICLLNSGFSYQLFKGFLKGTRKQQYWLFVIFPPNNYGTLKLVLTNALPLKIRNNYIN